jgi:23S rRNA pseudouridine955/2504/2580 synthase
MWFPQPASRRGKNAHNGSAMVSFRSVAAEEAGIRLDRWFRRHFPTLPHGLLQKLLRLGQIRVDGSRAKAGARLEPGQRVRIPPLVAPKPARPEPLRLDAKAMAELQSRVLYRDDDVLVINKPAGLAVQGGSQLTRHLDAMLDAFRFGAERPRLVHRLDKDTSGVLVLARSAFAAARLTKAFRGPTCRGGVRKLYWALVAGVPEAAEGRIEVPLGKGLGPGGERMMVDQAKGKRAVTLYRVVERAGRRAAWLSLQPLTGRTHQLRVHCLNLGTPIVGDGKYGGKAAYLGGAVSPKLHLHARAIEVPKPTAGSEGQVLRVAAPLPEHMAASWRLFGFSAKDADRFLAE